MSPVRDLPAIFAAPHRALEAELASLSIGASQAGSPGDRALASALADAGLFARVVPLAEELDVRAICLIREALAPRSPAADSILAVQGLGTTPLRLADFADQALLANAAAGAAIFGFALTEPGAGSDVAAIATSAERDGDSYILRGHKTLISNVGIATHYTVFANADPSAGRRGITAFVVPADSPNLVETPLEVIAAHPIGSLAFDGVRVPIASRVGEVGDGFRLAMQTLDRFRVTVGAAAVGMAARALELALRHCRERVQFGAPLADKQLVQAALAEMATDIDASRLLVYRAASIVDGASDGVPATRAVAQAKLFATEACSRAIDRAVQLLGGRGVTVGEEVEHLYRAIRPLRIYEGASDIQKLIIYRSLAEEHSR